MGELWGEGLVVVLQASVGGQSIASCRWPRYGELIVRSWGVVDGESRVVVVVVMMAGAVFATCYVPR